MHFEKEYFEKVDYSHRMHLIKRHITEVLEWGSRIAGVDLLDGQGKTALDVGCAYGYGVAVLKSHGYDSSGVDVSRYSIEQARRSNHSIDLAVCDVQKGLPFKDEVFDLVICFEVLEHLQDPLQAIRNISDACKHIMIYTTPNRAVDRSIKKMVRDFDETHINARTPQEWKAVLNGNVQGSEVKIESFFDSTLRFSDRLLFFKSFRVPHFGLDTRILVKKTMEATQ